MTVAHTYDDDLSLKASAAVTSSAAGTLILDLGTGETRGDVVIEVSAMDIASNDEIYDIVLQGSPDAAFGTAGNIQELTAISLSAKEVKRTGSDKDDTTGRYVVPFSNRHGETNYRYVRIYTVVGAASSSITYRAFLTKS
jgi:hypothetical protein